MKKLTSLVVFAAVFCCLPRIASAVENCHPSWASADADCKKALGAGHCATAGADGCPNMAGGAVHCAALVAGGGHPRSKPGDKTVPSTAGEAAKADGKAAAKEGIPSGRRQSKAAPEKAGGKTPGK